MQDENRLNMYQPHGVGQRGTKADSGSFSCDLCIPSWLLCSESMGTAMRSSKDTFVSHQVWPHWWRGPKTSDDLSPGCISTEASRNTQLSHPNCSPSETKRKTQRLTWRKGLGGGAVVTEVNGYLYCSTFSPDRYTYISFEVKNEEVKLPCKSCSPLSPQIEPETERNLDQQILVPQSS